MEQTYIVYIVLSMSGTKFSRFLRLMSKSEFTHVSLSFDENLETLYSFGRQKLNMPWIAGYVEEHPDKGIFKMYNPMCEVIAINISENKYLGLKESLISFQKNSKEYKYDFLGLFYLYLNKPHKLHRHFTCTEFVAWLLDSVDISPETDKHVSLIVPNDYYTIPNSRPIYKGRLWDYCYGN